MFAVVTYSQFSDEESDPHAKGILGLIRIPGVLIMVFAIMMAALSLTFIDPTLQPHLAEVSCVKRKLILN